MSLRNEQCNKVCRIIDDVLANRPAERDSLIVAVRKAFEALGHLPSAQHWIPCSERLPEEDNVEVLCTVKQQRKTDHSEIIVEQGCYFYGTWLLSYDNQRVNCSREVLAWQPLPSPYREEADEVEPEIIRCKDCVHYSSHKDDYMCGINVLAYIHENDFCSRAERRTQ